MRALIAFFSLSAFLCGCTTTVAQQADQAAREVDRMVQVYGPACEKLGYKSGTDPWRSCVLQLSAKDDLSRSRYSYYGAYNYPYWNYPNWVY